MDGRPAQLELWGGAECTIARIGDDWRDQGAETGHRGRLDDIDRMAELGIRAVRFPILWEAACGEAGDAPDLDWAEQRLGLLQDRGIRVVAGLLHHGSGPAGTDLLDPDFPPKFAAYAARVAGRFPWIQDWTPVNEPLTTARFSCLYGHWYPHRRDYPSFLRALVNQCRATQEAMAAIRAVNPAARLLQTEDLGKTFSTAPLAGQARHENARRWLSLDLLCGRVGARHPLRHFLDEAGVGQEALARLETGSARPDMIGINHYLTSERFLDHRPQLYPGLAPGGNGRDLYVDAEAVRVRSLEGKIGIAPRLTEAWRRYGLPLAITEVHHGCSREEQLRWFIEVWRSAVDLHDTGVDLRAVTLWSLFGNVDWRSLLTRREGCHDTGAFDSRSSPPRATVLARAATALAQGREFDHPVLDRPGWWRRPQRLYGAAQGAQAQDKNARPLLIAGATGTLGQAFVRICEHRGLACVATKRSELDLCDGRSVRAAIDSHRPWAVINAAGFVRVADAEREREACFAWNSDGAERLAQACEEAQLPLVTFSSDLVFDGTLGRRYREDDPVSPACAYGESKAEAERRVLAATDRALVIRTAAFFGPWDRYNFAWNVVSALARGEKVRACPLTRVSPTFVPDLCHAALDLLIDGETGLWHLANEGQLSWHGFARAVAAGAGYDPSRVVETPAERSRCTALASGRGQVMRTFDIALSSYLAEIGQSAADEALAAE